MFEEVFLFVFGLIFILIATMQDLKEKEVDNWISFSLIIFALGFRFFYSLFGGKGFEFFYMGLFGLGVFFILGNVFYYSRIFAGGDAKLMIALGTILPLSVSFYENIKYFMFFILIFFVIGAFYGLLGSFILMFKNLRNFNKQFKKEFRKNKNKIFLVMFLGLFFMILGFQYFLFIVIGIFIFVSPYLFVYSKAIEESAMVSKIRTSKLREGDWLYARVKLGKGYLEPNWDGLTKDQIKKIKKQHKFIKIKQGIAFVPVFLISFIIYFIVGKYLYTF